MKLNFRKFGEGPAVIILHGLLGSSDNWQSFGKELANEGYAVFLADLRNHGLSAHNNEFNYNVLAADVYELIMDQIALPVAIMGHSLGGKTAMTLAFLHPEIISCLLVIDIAPRQYPVQHRHILDALRSIDTAAVKTRKEVESQLMTQLKDPPTVQFLLKNLYWKEKNLLAWRFNLPVINENIEAVGKRTAPSEPLTKPTLFIKGEQSEYISRDDEMEISGLFNNVEIKSAPGAGHWVHADNPSWLLGEVMNFLTRYHKK